MKGNKLKVINTIAIAIIYIGVFIFFRSGVWVNDAVKKNEEVVEQEEKTELFESVLKPCPLCGHEVKLIPIDEDFYIECERYNFEDHDDHGCGLKTGYYKNKDELIKMWNAMEGRGYTEHEQLPNEGTLRCSRDAK